MKINISEDLKVVLKKFRELSEENQLYTMSILLNHITNGQINDGNYTDSDEAYENDKLVLEPYQIKLTSPMELATNLLLIASTKEGITINPSGIDIKPFINLKSKIEVYKIISDFYKLDYKNKIDFLTETFYIIFEIEDVYKKIDFDFNELIYNLLSYSREEFHEPSENNLKI